MLRFSFGFSVKGGEYGKNLSEATIFGSWWAYFSNGERVSGNWRVGSHEILENNTPISNDDWDKILNDSEFWRGDTDNDNGFQIGSWDGENFKYIEYSLLNVDGKGKWGYPFVEPE